jgi:NAD(P)H-hydrate epimerase
MLSNLRIPTTEQIRKIEQAYIELASSDSVNWGQVLMELAGRGAANALLSLWHLNPGLVTVLAGPGNNGGDGFVLARFLALWGVPVVVYHLKSKARYSKEAQHNCKILETLSVPVLDLEELSQENDNLGELLKDICNQASLLVDALFGTGLDREIQGPYAEIINKMNESQKLIMALDIPSGINSDTGQIMGTAVGATKTVTFGSLKPGLLFYPGHEHCGEINLAEIGLPELSNLPSLIKLEAPEPEIFLTTCQSVRLVWPLRSSDANKGTFGSTLTIGGSQNMPGAGVMASQAALRSGCGLSYFASPASVVHRVTNPEIICLPLAQTEKNTIALTALKSALEYIDASKAVILGPGISLQEETSNFVLSLFELINKPCVVDADALNALAQNPQSLPPTGNFILTPHPKELSRLMQKPVSEILADKVSAALASAKFFKAVVVLKGASTVIASPDGQAFINPTGCNSLATAGSGDVLAGIIGSLLAQGLTCFKAAVAGVYLHGRCGDLARKTIGETGTIAGDLINFIPQAITSVQEGDLSSLEEQLATSVLSL